MKKAMFESQKKKDEKKKVQTNENVNQEEEK